MCKAKSAKAQSLYYWNMDGKNLMLVLDIELPDDKNIQRQLR